MVTLHRPKSPDTTAIRAFAAGMRTSVGIRDETMATKSRLLDLCDALDAERAANAEMRRALNMADEVLQRIRTRIVQAPTRDLPGVLLHDATDDLTHRAQQSVRSALRAAEKAPETTEPATPAGDGLAESAESKRLSSVTATLAEHEEMGRWKRLPIWAQQELEHWRGNEAHQRGRAELAEARAKALENGAVAPPAAAEKAGGR